MSAIRLENVSKAYRIYPTKLDRLKEVASFGRLRRGHDFWALQGIDLEVERGATLGILGRNGAGKSTLLEVISGYLPPTTGSVEANGQLVFLQLGAGFNKEFTGRENVMLNGLILGIDRKKMLERFEEIEAFAELGEFMDQPLKTYSSGMRARLGFAVAVNVEPDILIVDETLSVGDTVFKQMGMQRMRELRDQGTTILFVSHSAQMVRSFCTEAILLHEGKLLSSGDTSDTLDQYEALTSSLKAANKKGHANETYNIDQELLGNSPDFKENAEFERRPSRLRHGTGEARISDVEVLDEEQESTNSIAPSTKITTRVHLKYVGNVKPSKLHITLRNKAGLDVFSTRAPVKRSSSDDNETRIIVDFRFDTPLQPGIYSINAAITHPGSEKVYLDWLDVAATFRIVRPEGQSPVLGLLDLPAEVEVHRPDLGQHTDQPA